MQLESNLNCKHSISGDESIKPEPDLQNSSSRASLNINPEQPNINLHSLFSSNQRGSSENQSFVGEFPASSSGLDKKESAKVLGPSLSSEFDPICENPQINHSKPQNMNDQFQLFSSTELDPLLSVENSRNPENMTHLNSEVFRKQDSDTLRPVTQGCSLQINSQNEYTKLPLLANENINDSISVPSSDLSVLAINTSISTPSTSQITPFHSGENTFKVQNFHANSASPLSAFQSTAQIYPPSSSITNIKFPCESDSQAELEGISKTEEILGYENKLPLSEEPRERPAAINNQSKIQENVFYLNIYLSSLINQYQFIYRLTIRDINLRNF